MRLTESERLFIADAVAAEFGPDAPLLLFGSRLDDSLHGGDIDLFIDNGPKSADEVLARRLALALRLHDGLGERKIDVVVHRLGGPDLPIHQHARQTGVRVWP